MDTVLLYDYRLQWGVFPCLHCIPDNGKMFFKNSYTDSLASFMEKIPVLDKES